MQTKSIFVVLIAGLLFTGCAAVQTPPTVEERQALAPTGKLRAAIIQPGPVYAAKDPESGQLKGVAVDLASEMARRLGVPLEVVTYRNAVEILGSAHSNQWDIVFLGILPERAKIVDYSTPYARVEVGYLVGEDAGISDISQVDRPGVRIAVLQKAAADTFLTATIKAATLVRTATIADSVEMVRSGRAHAMAAVKTYLYPTADKLPGSRVLEGSIDSEDIGVGVPKGKALSASYVRKFVDEAKSGGLVKAAIERAGVRGLLAAP